ncbi:PUA domain-containing protein [Methanosalsum natronophilum]|nr:uncharacterized protein with predicted RNA binding PUA domain [Methanosalsum natronophilum]
MADYQFGKGSGTALFDDDVSFQYSKTKRVRQIVHNGDRIATVRAKDGIFTLSIKGATRLHSHLPWPNMRVVIHPEAKPFVSTGKTAFAKHVIDIDPQLRVGEEVLVVDSEDNLLATGQLMMNPNEILGIDRGPAVDVRLGIK